tara:strand:+ start:1066 stop:1707 length:642 start_codon:yes stop_codon:yes gene_type:complete
MINLDFILLLLLSYLIGAFPSSYLLGKFFYNIDIRKFGSGNVGATNTFRILGKIPGSIVLIIDIFKGWIVVNFIHLFESNVFFEINNSELIFEFQLLLGIIAIVGHIFPIYINFKGGKGIATILGVLIALNLTAALYSCIIFLFFLFFSKFVSLSSIIATIFYSIFILFIYESSINAEKLFAIFVPFLSLITHRKNILRLIRKEETKVKFGPK